MKLSFFGLLIALASIAVPVFLFAASTDFTIRMQIVNDTLPPTTPIMLSAVPVASTQINISWSAATDDIAVAGYRLFRNSVQIATTTLLSYNDTGLTASTTYSYTVDAFDTFFNISSTSAPLATTTLSSIITPTPTSSASSSSNSSTRVQTPSLKGTLTLSATDTKAEFTWLTTIPTRYTLTWGRTPSYELGAVSGIIFNAKNFTEINALEPGTVYYYKLQATDARGNTTIISADSFTTKNSKLVGILPNVLNFTATVSGTDAALVWRNNFTDPKLYVRVVRSHLFYPSTLDNGAVVYEGTGESFVDTEALAKRSPQYYTVFVLDGSGSVSGGSVARADKKLDIPQLGSSTSVQPVDGSGILLPDVGAETILRAANITISQQSTNQSLDQALKFNIGVPFMVSISSASVPKNLKSIIVSIQNPSNQREVSAYLLKLNPEGDRYQALIPAPLLVGSARITVEVFDYELETVRRISTQITFVNDSKKVPFFPDQLVRYGGHFIQLAFLGSLIFWVWFYFKKLR